MGYLWAPAIPAAPISNSPILPRHFRSLPGQQARLGSVSLTRQPTFISFIWVAGNSARMPQPLMVFDRSGQSANATLRINSQTGAFELNLPNGSYYAETFGRGEKPLYARVDFTVAGAPVSGITLVPVPVPPIPVEIHEEFTANPAPAFGAPGVFSRIDGPNGDQPPVQISFDPVDQPLSGPMGVNMRRDPGSTDTFLMAPPRQGAYRLEVQAFGPQIYAASITSGSSDLLREPLIIGSGGSVQPIQITLRNDAGFLQCTTKADPAPTADHSAIRSAPISVVAIPADDAMRRIYFSYAQDAGSPTSPLPLPPGKYLVLAFEKEREIDLDDAAAMSRLAAQGQTVTIQPGATLNLQVDPIRDGDEEAAQ